MSVKAERPYDRLPFPYGDALTQSDLQVATVDYDDGWLVLDTNDGLVSLNDLARRGGERRRG